MGCVKNIGVGIGCVCVVWSYIFCNWNGGSEDCLNDFLCGVVEFVGCVDL